MSRFKTTVATKLNAVTPNDGEDLSFPCLALNVAEAGFVKVTTIDGDTGIIYVAAGFPFEIAINRVWATDTTAIGIKALA